MTRLFSWDLYRPFLYVLHDSFRSVLWLTYFLEIFISPSSTHFFFGNLLCTLKVSYTYGWVMRRESCPACIYIWMSHESWVMSCTWIRSESCCTSEWVMRHAWGMSHVPCMNGSRIISYVWIRNESCPIYEFVLRHVWMRTARHDSWLMTHSYIYEWVTNHVLRMNS